MFENLGFDVRTCFFNFGVKERDVMVALCPSLFLPLR